MANGNVTPPSFLFGMQDIAQCCGPLSEIFCSQRQTNQSKILVANATDPAAASSLLFFCAVMTDATGLLQ